jgi:hypothetical protein
MDTIILQACLKCPHGPWDLLLMHELALALLRDSLQHLVD